MKDKEVKSTSRDLDPEDLTLSELRVGEEAEIVKMAARGEIKKRLLEMGLVPGARIKLERVAPLGDPVEILILGYHLSLRQSEARAIMVRHARPGRSAGH